MTFTEPEIGTNYVADESIHHQILFGSTNHGQAGQGTGPEWERRQMQCINVKG